MTTYEAPAALIGEYPSLSPEVIAELRAAEHNSYPLFVVSAAIEQWMWS